MQILCEWAVLTLLQVGMGGQKIYCGYQDLVRNPAGAGGSGINKTVRCRAKGQVFELAETTET